MGRAGTQVLIRGAEIDGGGPIDVRIGNGRILEVAPGIVSRPDEPVLDAAGGALLPGLHDHHIHLFALAAALDSVRCGPPAVRDEDALSVALNEAAVDPAGWIRGVGYHESVAGELGAAALDALGPEGRPVRIQHRTGALWILNSAALRALRLDAAGRVEGLERDSEGRPTGRLFGLDGWLRDRLPVRAGPPALDRVGRRLAQCGVTGVTDATPGNAQAEMAAFARAIETDALPQRLMVMGTRELARPVEGGDGRLQRGAFKVLLQERDLPDFDELRRIVEAVHEEGRGVAIHCVTRAELTFASALLASIPRSGLDRIEHASVAPPELLEALAGTGATVVTQPNFVFERGDAYLREVEEPDGRWLYRCAGVLEAGIPLGGGTDAPFGDPDPWRAIRAAVDRRTETGRALGAKEALGPEAALSLFTSPAASPGAEPRAVAPGERADLCLLDRPWRRAREVLEAACVRATIRGGSIIWERS